MKKNKIGVDRFYHNICNISEPINPRDALFGGRTNPNANSFVYDKRVIVENFETLPCGF